MVCQLGLTSANCVVVLPLWQGLV